LHHIFIKIFSDLFWLYPLELPTEEIALTFLKGNFSFKFHNVVMIITNVFLFHFDNVTSRNNGYGDSFDPKRDFLFCCAI